MQAGNAWFIYTHFSNARDSDLASFILFPFHNGHCDVFHGFSHFGVPDNKMNRRRFFLGHDRPASLMDKNLDMAERRRFCFPQYGSFYASEKSASSSPDVPDIAHRCRRYPLHKKRQPRIASWGIGQTHLLKSWDTLQRWSRGIEFLPSIPFEKQYVP